MQTSANNLQRWHIRGSRKGIGKGEAMNFSDLFLYATFWALGPIVMELILNRDEMPKRIARDVEKALYLFGFLLFMLLMNWVDKKL